jgi:small GTP-binding protein
VELSLWDTSGAEEYDRLRPLSYANAQVFLLVFSVADQASFEHIASKWHPEVAHFCPDVPRILVGTQIELRSDAETVSRLQAQGKRCVTRPEAEAAAARVKAICYLECSSRTGENRRRVFEEAVRAALCSQRSLDLGCVVC